MKSLARILSFVLLCVAIVAGTFDSIRSVATSSVDMTSTIAAWKDIYPSSLTMAEGAVTHYIHPDAWGWLVAWLNSLPAFALFLDLALLFWMVGYRKPQIRSRFG